MRRLLLLAIGPLLFSCDSSTLEATDPYQFVVPEHFPPPTYSFENNPISKKGFLLGKKLFNDPILSRDGSIACSNCHSRAVAFADPQHRLSVGINDLVGIRNAPPLANLAFKPSFFWDGGVTHLDFVPINAIESEFEMGETLLGVVTKLNKHAAYPALFQEVFPEMDTVNAPMLLHALSQYMNLLVSDQSKYDQYLRKEIDLNPDELAGLTLFKQHCSTCHQGPLLTNQSFANNGLDAVFSDPGRALISEGTEDLGKFSIPSLRNIALTAPYMHDGRFGNLEEVIEHYRFGVKASDTLAPELQTNGKVGIVLSDQEQKLLIEFLQTLTDYEFIANDLF